MAPETIESQLQAEWRNLITNKLDQLEHKFDMVFEKVITADLTKIQNHERILSELEKNLVMISYTVSKIPDHEARIDRLEKIWLRIAAVFIVLQGLFGLVFAYLLH